MPFGAAWIAKYNVNGINGRLANLLGWLEESTPDAVCLRELKALDDRFPAPALRAEKLQFSQASVETVEPLRRITVEGKLLGL